MAAIALRAPALVVVAPSPFRVLPPIKRGLAKRLTEFQTVDEAFLSVGNFSMNHSLGAFSCCSCPTNAPRHPGKRGWTMTIPCTCGAICE